MSVEEFCAQVGISRASFYRIRRRAEHEGLAAALTPRSRAPRHPARVWDQGTDERIAQVRADLLAAGIKRENIILDPGFGFAKTTEQNYELLAGLHCLCALGYPVLAGLSRKSMIYRVLDATPAESLAGTVALGWECLRQGAAILRVHDVQEAVDTVRLFDAYERNRK